MDLLDVKKNSLRGEKHCVIVESLPHDVKHRELSDVVIIIIIIERIELNLLLHWQNNSECY